MQYALHTFINRFCLVNLSFLLQGVSASNSEGREKLFYFLYLIKTVLLGPILASLNNPIHSDTSKFR